MLSTPATGGSSSASLDTFHPTPTFTPVSNTTAQPDFNITRIVAGGAAAGVGVVASGTAIAAGVAYKKRKAINKYIKRKRQSARDTKVTQQASGEDIGMYELNATYTTEPVVMTKSMAMP